MEWTRSHRPQIAVSIRIELIKHTKLVELTRIPHLLALDFLTVLLNPRLRSLIHISSVDARRTA